MLLIAALHTVSGFVRNRALPSQCCAPVLAGFDQPPPGGVVPGMAPGFVVPGMTGLQAAAMPAPAFSAPPGADPVALASMRPPRSFLASLWGCLVGVHWH